MKKAITVKELHEQLKRMVEDGYGDLPVWFLDWNESSWAVEEGVHDIYEGKDEKVVILG